MNENDKIIQNFKTYDTFLASLGNKDRKIAISLKMMYSIHMENVQEDKKTLFMITQIIRFLLKLVAMPFYRSVLNLDEKKLVSIVLKDTKIEEYIANNLNVPIVEITNKISLNKKIFRIYKQLFKSCYLLLQNSSLNKRYILALLHHLIDYLVTCHTIEVNDIQVLFLENDRTPANLALIHRCIENKIKTVKYDNWLIDPINHNDVYCEYYYYPSEYHKKIIQSFASNSKLIYIKGGFAYWDNLAKYKHVKENKVKNIIYFTQFGISLETHKNYILDIRDSMKELGLEYEIMIKVHPREDIYRYKKFLKDFHVVGECDDIYAVIEGADYCFSVFSTISLEAKHIIKNSFFINYNANDFDIVDYNSLKLDLVKDKEMLTQIFKGEFMTISQNEFIKYANCQYPQSVKKLKRFMNGFNNNSIT